MTPLSSEAERLADKCARWDISDSDKDDIAALLRRIPELEAERDQLRAALSTPAQDQQGEPTLRDYAESLVDAGHDFWKACNREVGGGAVRWLSCDDGTLIVFTRCEYRDAIMRNVGGYKAPEVVFAEDGMTASEAQAQQSIDAEALIRAVLPGGSSCDPQTVADEIRRYLGQWPGQASTFAEIIEAASPTPPAQQKGGEA